MPLSKESEHGSANRAGLYPPEGTYKQGCLRKCWTYGLRIIKVDDVQGFEARVPWVGMHLGPHHPSSSRAPLECDVPAGLGLGLTVLVRGDDPGATKLVEILTAAGCVVRRAGQPKVTQDGALDADTLVAEVTFTRPQRRLAVLEQLSLGEWTTVRLIAQGNSHEEVSRQLNIRPMTVRGFLKRAYGKLGVRRVEGILWRLLIELEPSLERDP